MTPGARLLAAVDIINNIFRESKSTNLSVDVFIRNWTRNNRYAGSKDRKEIINNIYGIIKRYYSLEYIKKNSKGLNNDNLDIVIIYYIFYVCGKITLLSYFNDGPYAIQLNKKIKDFIEEISLFNINNSEYIKCGLPDWLYKEFYESYKKDTYKVCESLFTESHFDIRVRVGHNRDTIINKLKSYNINAEKTPLSPFGLRLDKRTNINNLIEFKMGIIEIQDEGSQLVSLLCGAKENEYIIDLCAGAGGKSLFLADLLNKTNIFATDINLLRLNNIKERIIRNKVENKINIELEYNNINILADRVICDVPCTGSGAWRRRPEEKINLTENKFQNLLRTQRKILNYGAKLTKQGGELVYITCSLINKENKDQINSFLIDNPVFEIVDLEHSWNNIIKSSEDFGNNKFCQLLPNIHECDGFFIARLIKVK